MLYKRELLVAVIAGGLALLAIFNLPALVAKPKLLFGRSLSAIEPTLFPYITLALLVLLSVILALACIWQWIRLRTPSDDVAAAILNVDTSGQQDWRKICGFFGLLVGYGLMLKPLGFLISSFIVICATSLMLGNRHFWQILLIGILSPIGLYLLATRGLLVSLPELDQIELFYARALRIIGLFSRSQTP